MKAFTYERADIARRGGRRRRRAAPGAKFIAGGTNLLDLMKLADRDADASDRRQRPRPRHDRGDRRRRPAHRRAGAQHRSRRRRARAARLRRAVARAARRRLGPAAQQGDDRRQSAAAHALSLLLRHQPAVQQAPARQRLRAIGGVSRQLAVIGASEACIATHPSDMAVAMRVARRDGRDGARRRPQRGASRSPTSIACPATRRRSRPSLERGRTDHRGDAAASRSAARRSTARCATAPPMRSRWSRSAAIVQRDGSGRVALGGVAHKPWRVEAAEAEMPRGAKAVAARLLAGAKPTATTHSSCRWPSARSARCWPKRGAEP